MVSRRLKKIAGCFILGLATISPLSAQTDEVAPVETQEERTITNPEELAPPRTVPLKRSLPSVTDPTLSRELLHLDLRTAMGQVLGKTPTLEKINSRIRQAEYRVQEAFTSAYPTLDFQAQYSRVQPPIIFPGGTVISPADNYQFTLTLRQAIYDFGRMKWNVLARKLAKRAIQEEYRTELNRLILLVAQRYIEALLSQEQVVIAQDDLEAQLANLRTSQLLFEQGVAARFDVLRNSAAASQAQQVLIEAETSETIAKARLLSLLEQPLDRRLQLDALPIFAPSDSLHLADAKILALETRPDLRSLRWAVEESRAQVELAETGNNPRLDLTNTTINQNATGFSPETQNTTAIVLSIPLYDGGVTHLQKEQAMESVNQITHDLEQAERDAVLQIDEIFHQLSDRWRAIAVSEENVTQAEEALRVAVLRYENGISTNVELLESQAARSRARFELARARGNYLLSRWSWWQATAGVYPTEVPLPEDIRARLDGEGLPNGLDAFSDKETGENLGPLLPDQKAPVLPIRGLPTPESEGDASSPAGSPDPK
jgi:outer membrane protein